MFNFIIYEDYFMNEIKLFILGMIDFYLLFLFLFFIVFFLFGYFVCSLFELVFVVMDVGGVVNVFELLEL